MAVLQFPGTTPTDLCAACERPTAGHFVGGRAIGCRSDVVIGRDQVTLARRLRLARLQGQVARVQPFGMDVEGMDARG